MGGRKCEMDTSIQILYRYCRVDRVLVMAVVGVYVQCTNI